MFIVCETIAWGMEHVPFNAALLKIIRLAYPNETINFYAEESHLANVRDQISEDMVASIVWKNLVLPLRHSSFYARLFSDFRTVKFLLNELNENPLKDVLVITAEAPVLWALKFYTGNIYKDKRVQVIIHGDFTTLHRTPRKSILNPFYYIGSLKTALRLSGYERLQHIVLEETVRDAILKQLPLLRNSVGVLDHPIPVDNQHVGINNFDSPIQFGFLGHASEKKGFSEYLTVATEIMKRFSGQAKFHFIGAIHEKIRHKNKSKMAFLSEKPVSEPLSRNEYVNRLKRLHYVCFFYDKYYEACASGVLLDSIAYEKPFIATQLPIFKTIENRFGDIGYLCRKNEFSKTICGIIQANDYERYKRQVANMCQVKASRTPEMMAKKYRDLVNCI